MFDSVAMTGPLKMRWILTRVAAVFLLAVTPANAQDYEATRHAAEQGDADAQFNLGVAYATGEGVPQDYVTAERERVLHRRVRQGIGRSGKPRR